MGCFLEGLKIFKQFKYGFEERFSLSVGGIRGSVQGWENTVENLWKV